MKFHGDTRWNVSNSYSADRVYIVDVAVNVQRDIEITAEASLDVDNQESAVPPPIGSVHRKYKTLREYLVFRDPDRGIKKSARVKFRPGEDGYLPLFAYDHTGRLTPITDPVIVRITDADDNLYLDHAEAMDELYDHVYGYPFRAPDPSDDASFGTWSYTVRGGTQHQFFTKTFDFEVSNTVDSAAPNEKDVMILSGRVRDLANRPIEDTKVHVYVMGRFYDRPVDDEQITIKTDEDGTFKAGVPLGGRIKVRIPCSSFEQILSTDASKKNVNRVSENIIAYRREEG